MTNNSIGKIRFLPSAWMQYIRVLVLSATIPTACCHNMLCRAAERTIEIETGLSDPLKFAVSGNLKIKITPESLIINDSTGHTELQLSDIKVINVTGESSSTDAADDIDDSRVSIDIMDRYIVIASPFRVDAAMYTPSGVRIRDCSGCDIAIDCHGIESGVYILKINDTTLKIRLS